MTRQRRTDDPEYGGIYYGRPALARQAEARGLFSERRRTARRDQRAGARIKSDEAAQRDVWAGGNVVTLTAPGSVKSGDLIVVGALAGVCAYDASVGEEVEVSLVGVYELPKATGQINEGAAVWWDTSPGNVVNATQAGAFPIGVAVRGAGSSDTVVRVRLSGVPVTAAGG